MREILWVFILICGMGSSALAKKAAFKELPPSRESPVKVEFEESVTDSKTSGNVCRIKVHYPTAKRDLSVGDIDYLMKQPGAIPKLQSLNPNFTATWLKKLVESNPGGAIFPLQAPSGSAPCNSMSDLQKMLAKRIADKQWPVQEMSQVISESLANLKQPPFEEAGGAATRPGSPAVPGSR